jgi:bifunctional non-homologous end joining protein LigD
MVRLFRSLELLKIQRVTPSTSDVGRLFCYPVFMSARSVTDYQPQLATLVKQVPDGDSWLHEIKYDGYRIGCVIADGNVRLISRNGNDWTGSFPEIRDAALSLGIRDALIDGEVAVELGDGRTSFHALQAASGGAARGRLTYFVFDLLRLDGEDISRQPLEQRKSSLLQLVARLPGASRIRYAQHIEGSGAEVLRQACRLGLEGIVSKRRVSQYRSGRSDDWLKIKCTASQEFIIGGFTERVGEPNSIGALVIGIYDTSGRLVFAGKVGTGFTAREALALRKRLEALALSDCPFQPCPKGALSREAHWVRPELIAEVAFTEWTPDGKVRHPSFKGLRSDKPAREIVMERPVASAPALKRRFRPRSPGRN